MSTKISFYFQHFNRIYHNLLFFSSVLGIDRFKDNDNELFSTSDHLMIECDLVVETITADLVMIRDCYNKADYDKIKEKMLATPRLYGHLECVENWLKGRNKE